MNDGHEKKERPTTDRLLEVYLNDHLAGSVAGRELLDRCLDNNAEGPLGDFLRRLQGELEEDQMALRGVLKSFGGTEDRVKEATGWLAEKLGRLKLNGQLAGYSPLSRLEELEGLVLGIRGKMALWGTLEEMAATRGPLHGLDLALLQERARRQHEEAEVHRREAARRALEPS
jgi:hypothetical protein